MKKVQKFLTEHCCGTSWIKLRKTEFLSDKPGRLRVKNGGSKINTVHSNAELINMILLTGYFCVLGVAIHLDNW
ncbi:hypothetical protein KBP51_03505 [Lactiplantibacillus pentosus]|uniref:hypothetical protein n=1 Tax=Lactiplantibacillus pentosus TaxID=1589 RepID=UPI0013310788|nr:hypothetical protein [Lactiplantibacillus pentosus]MBQ0835533.1 hypothetical protein [Lactiplantibacillus pentosus]